MLAVWTNGWIDRYVEGTEEAAYPPLQLRTFEGMSSDAGTVVVMIRLGSWLAASERLARRMVR